MEAVSIHISLITVAWTRIHRAMDKDSQSHAFCYLYFSKVKDFRQHTDQAAVFAVISWSETGLSTYSTHNLHL